MQGVFIADQYLLQKASMCQGRRLLFLRISFNTKFCRKTLALQQCLLYVKHSFQACFLLNWPYYL